VTSGHMLLFLLCECFPINSLTNKNTTIYTEVEGFGLKSGAAENDAFDKSSILVRANTL
jgi:hypothetical protein